jgi:hypothetical protein
MDCKKEKNMSKCTCTYGSCGRKGICCDCLHYHRTSREIPGCFFPADAESTYDRSFEHFARLVSTGKI